MAFMANLFNPQKEIEIVVNKIEEDKKEPVDVKLKVEKITSNGLITVAFNQQLNVPEFQENN